MVTQTTLFLCLSSCQTHYDRYGSATATIASYQPGYEVRFLPQGYRSEIISGTKYYYQGGNYYRSSAGGYVVIDPPRYSRHYEEYKRHRQGKQRDSRYDIEDYDRNDRRYLRGDVLPLLPDGYRIVSYGGRMYYEVGERYYMRRDGLYHAVSRPY